MIEKKLSWKIFGLKAEELAGGWIKLHNGELRNF
jgi:hypothetical protein